MSRPSTIDIDGRRYLWRNIMEHRRRQIAEHRAAQGSQPTLFALKDDARPAAERTAAASHKPGGFAFGRSAGGIRAYE